jgi:uncharacterized membrane protein (UPF0182 family)
VIVAYRDQIVMAETLDAALDQIFGGGKDAPDGRAPRRRRRGAIGDRAGGAWLAGTAND